MASDNYTFGEGIATLNGNAYVTGLARANSFPVVNAIQSTRKGLPDAFVAQVDATGSSLAFSTYLGGSSFDEAVGIAVDALGNAYVTGHTRSKDFPLASPYQGAYGGGDSDAFITKILLAVTATQITAPSSITYGSDANIVVNVTSTAATVTGDVSLAVNGGTPITQPLSAGSSTFILSGLAAGAYTLDVNFPLQGGFLPSSATATLVVNPAPLTITANNANKVLDAPNPAFTASYSGFVLGESPSVLSGTLSCTTTALTTSPVGPYPITCSGQSSTNYSISYVPGVLSVLYASGGVCDGAPGHQILPPINPLGLSVFNQGKTVPAQFRVCDALGVSIGNAGVVSSFFLTGIVAGGVTTTVQDVVANANDGNNAFNISTKNLLAGDTYIYTISLNDGSSIVFQYGLR